MSKLLDLLFRRHREELMAFAEQKGNYQNAEDLVQDAFLRLLQYDDIQGIENHRAYLFKITANLSADQFRRKSWTMQADAEEAELETFVCPMPLPETAAESQQTYQRCMQALESLPDIVKTVFLLHRVDGVPQAEIGKVFGLPTRTVERYCAKALAHCCDSLKDDRD